MNGIKKLFGIITMALGVFAGYYLFTELSLPKFGTGKADDLIPALIYTIILCPLIMGSMITFGYYALKGKYDLD